MAMGGLSIGLLLGVFFILACHRLARRLANRHEKQPGLYWRAFRYPVDQPRRGPPRALIVCALPNRQNPRVVLAFAQTMAFYLSVAWLSIIILIIIGDMVVSSEHLKRSSLDNQLIRLSVRLIGAMCATAFLVRGADELGFRPIRCLRAWAWVVWPLRLQRATVLRTC